MEISEFEKTFRVAMGSDLMRPALASPGGSIRLDAPLPPEFQAAAKTLASRSGEQPKEGSILRSVAESWT